MSVLPQVVTSTLALWRGSAVRVGETHQPGQPLRLFDVEGCWHCRLVREALTELGLDAVIQPCPKGGERFRNQARELGGYERFPMLVDPSQGQVLYGSGRIRGYLWRQYGPGVVSGISSRKPLNNVRSVLASGSRLGRGVYAKPSRRPDRLLELYSFESSPFSRRVRERLCELELPYVLRNCGKSRAREWLFPLIRERCGIEDRPLTRNRRELLARTGKVALPYLVDPNLEIELYESDSILAHLRHYYQI
ncbi:glutathione S-transferase N-terminal domain-containing protein [Halomonadaceae bacterium KBTZ08]